MLAMDCSMGVRRDDVVVKPPLAECRRREILAKIAELEALRGEAVARRDRQSAQALECKIKAWEDRLSNVLRRQYLPDSYRIVSTN